jgi:hypothetical protein
MSAVAPVSALRYAFMSALTAVTFSTASFALGTDEQRAACTPDVFRLCSAQIPNVEAIVACLKREKSNLSPGCQTVFNAPSERAAPARSLATPANEWCAFGSAPDAGQQIWRNWCGDAAR